MADALGVFIAVVVAVVFGLVAWGLRSKGTLRRALLYCAALLAAFFGYLFWMIFHV